MLALLSSPRLTGARARPLHLAFPHQPTIRHLPRSNRTSQHPYPHFGLLSADVLCFAAQPSSSRGGRPSQEPLAPATPPEPAALLVADAPVAQPDPKERSDWDVAQQSGDEWADPKPFSWRDIDWGALLAA